MNTALIVAMTREGLMGRDNALPWHWPADLAHFKRTTRGHAVVMGRRTWESLRDNFGGPLRDRVNVVVSRAHGGAAPDGALRDGVHWFTTLPDALTFAARREGAPAAASGRRAPPAPAEALSPTAPPAPAALPAPAPTAVPAAAPAAASRGVPRVDGESFILGGAELFRVALSDPLAPPQRLIVTWVPSVPARAGDSFFPFTPPEAWILQRFKVAQQWSDAGGQLQFAVYERREDGSRPSGSRP